MILLLLGIIDSLPPVPDPFVFDIGALPRPAIRRLTQDYELNGLLGNPIGGEFSYRSVFGDADFTYRKGNDWIRYIDTRVAGAISIPVKKTVARLHSSYLYQARIDTINYFKPDFSFITINDFIFQAKGQYAYNRIADTTIDEYGLKTGLILNRVLFIPRFGIESVHSAFADLWGIEAGASLPPVTIIGEYKDHSPGFRVRFDHLFKGLRSVVEIDRTTRALYLEDLLGMSPIRYSGNITPSKEKIGLLLSINTRPLDLGLNYQNWESFPVPQDSNFYGTMARATDIGGYTRIGGLSIVDSIKIVLRYSNRRYQPVISTGMFISAWQLLSVNFFYDDYRNFKAITPGLSLKLSNLEIQINYYPATPEIYPDYFLKKRVSISLIWRGSLR